MRGTLHTFFKRPAGSPATASASSSKSTLTTPTKEQAKAKPANAGKRTPPKSTKAAAAIREDLASSSKKLTEAPNGVESISKQKKRPAEDCRIATDMPEEWQKMPKDAQRAACHALVKKRRLKKWKDNAEVLGSEAPKANAEAVFPARRKRIGRLIRKRGSLQPSKCDNCKETPSESSSKPDAAKAANKNQEEPPRKKIGAEVSRKASEKAAAESLAAGDSSFDALQKALDLLDIPASSSRTNVIPRGVAEVRGMFFGLFCYAGSVGVSAATTKHPNLCKLLISSLKAVDADFPFTGIQLNYNYTTRPHVDKNNCGCSYIVGFGDYEGGEVWVHDEEAVDEAVNHTLDVEDGDVSATYQAGLSFVGRNEDINKRWTQFDGNKLHFTQPFTGNRYSMIFFTSDQYAKSSAEVRESLKDHGFDFDWESFRVVENLQKKLADRAEIRRQLQKQREEEAREKAREEMMKRGRCIARIWADGWGHQCTAVCLDDQDMCFQHVKGNRWKTHGRFDGDLPPAKKEEMRRTQMKWVKRGLKPPPDEPWTKLVDLPDDVKDAD